MTIGGYTFVRNATKLAYPLKESILSIIDLVDEFIIAYIEGDDDDTTLEVLQSIKSDKIRIVKMDWIIDKFKKNTHYSYLSDVAKKECKSDWLFYLQVDEVVHEKYLQTIKKACQYYLEDKKVEGLLFNYRHFWGDYNHCFIGNGWYPREVRIIRNLPEIHSWRDAQSFRYYSQFEPTTEFYQSKKVTRKLNVVGIPCEIYHYGWVRPPCAMSTKQSRGANTWHGTKTDPERIDFDYGPLNKVPKFNDSHPRVMEERIDSMEWKQKLQYNGVLEVNRSLYKHEKLRYKLKGWIELNLLGGREIGGFRNYKIVSHFRNT